MAQSGLKGLNLKGFLGVNLRLDRLSLADEHLAKAINADLHTQPGAIVLRLGRSKQFTTALSDQIIRRLAKINGKRYQIAGRAVYRDQASILTGLSTNLFTTLQPFRPRNDTQTWAFIADQALMRKDNGTTVRNWGIAAPTVKPTLELSASGNLTGVYSIKYTYVRKVGAAVVHESNPSPVSNEVTAAGHALVTSITVPTDPQVTHVRIYRTVASGSLYLFDSEKTPGELIPGSPTNSINASELSTTSVEHGVTSIFEAAELALPVDPEMVVTNPSDLLDARTPTYRFTLASTDATSFGTQVWENGFTTETGRILGIFPWEYDLLEQTSLILVTFGARTSGVQQFTLPSGTYTVEYLWEKDQLEEVTPLTASVKQTSTNPQQDLWGLLLTQPDSALGSAVETDNDPPPNAGWVAPFQEHFFLSRNQATPHYLWWTKRNRPESVPAINFLPIGNADDPIQCHLPMAGQLGVLTRLTKYRVQGNSTSGFNAVEAMSHRGTPAPFAAVSTELGLLFVARDGVFLTSLSAEDLPLAEAILPLFFGETVNGMLPINWDAAVTMAAAVYKDRYYLTYPSGASATPDRMAVFSNSTKQWFFYDHPLRSLFVEEDVDDLVGGGTEGFVYILEDGTTDAGASITLDVETGAFPKGAESSMRKLFQFFRVDADCQGETVTAEFYIDGVLKRTVSITGNRTRLLQRLPEGSMGYTWYMRFRYTGSKRIRIHAEGTAALWLPLEMAA